MFVRHTIKQIQRGLNVRLHSSLCSHSNHETVLTSSKGLRKFSIANASPSEQDTQENSTEKNSDNLSQNEERDPRDRRVPVSWEKSVRYLNSEAYRETYGNYYVWQLYRRPLHKQFHQMPYTNRISCVKDGFIKTATPCPICRDPNLVLHERNLKLLSQFINPWTQEAYEMRKIHVCQIKYEELLVALYKAKDLGLLQFTPELRTFDYREFYTKEWIPKDYKVITAELADENIMFKKMQEIQDPTNKPYTLTDFP